MMRELLSLATLTSVVITQTDQTTQTSTLNHPLPAAFEASTKAFAYDSQVLISSWGVSASSWFPQDRPYVDAGWSSNPPWASHITRTTGNLGPQGANQGGIHHPNFSILILNRTDYSRYQYDARFPTWNEFTSQDELTFACQDTWQHNSDDWRKIFAESHACAISRSDQRNAFSISGQRSGNNQTSGTSMQLDCEATRNTCCAARSRRGSHDPKTWCLECRFGPSKHLYGKNGREHRSSAQRVQNQAKNRSGATQANAVQETSETNERMPTLTGPSSTAQTGEKRANLLVDASQDGAKMINGHQGQLSLIIFFAFACAFM